MVFLCVYVLKVLLIKGLLWMVGAMTGEIESKAVITFLKLDLKVLLLLRE